VTGWIATSIEQNVMGAAGEDRFGAQGLPVVDPSLAWVE